MVSWSVQKLRWDVSFVAKRDMMWNRTGLGQSWSYRDPHHQTPTSIHLGPLTIKCTRICPRRMQTCICSTYVTDTARKLPKDWWRGGSSRGRTTFYDQTPFCSVFGLFLFVFPFFLFSVTRTLPCWGAFACALRSAVPFRRRVGINSGWSSKDVDNNGQFDFEMVVRFRQNDVITESCVWCRSAQPN